MWTECGKVTVPAARDTLPACVAVECLAQTPIFIVMTHTNINLLTDSNRMLGQIDETN